MIFNNSKYTKWYYNIVNAAKEQQRCKSTQYYERHHIVPKSIGGTNEADNLVLLTAKEHFVCHIILPKMCILPEHQTAMAYAHFAMSGGNKVTRSERYTSRLHERLRLKYIQLISGENNPNYGKPLSQERKQKLMEGLMPGGVSIHLGKPKTKQQREKLSATRRANKTAVGGNNPMYGRNHTPQTKNILSVKAKSRCEDPEYIQGMISANPRSKPVMDDNGMLFPSLSSCGKHHGFIGLTAPRKRIKDNVWKYV